MIEFLKSVVGIYFGRVNSCMGESEVGSVFRFTSLSRESYDRLHIYYEEHLDYEEVFME